MSNELKNKLKRKEYFDLVDRIGYEILSIQGTDKVAKVFKESEESGIKVYGLSRFVGMLRTTDFLHDTKYFSVVLKKCISNSVIEYLANNTAMTDISKYLSKEHTASRGIELPKDKPNLDELFDVPSPTIEISTGFRINRDFFEEETSEYSKPVPTLPDGAEYQLKSKFGKSPLGSLMEDTEKLRGLELEEYMKTVQAIQNSGMCVPMNKGIPESDFSSLEMKIMGQIIADPFTVVDTLADPKLTRHTQNLSSTRTLGLGATNLADKSMSKEEVYECLDKALKLLYETKPTLEKPMRNLKITKPTLVGGINILVASDDTLAGLIREAQDQIKANEDLAACSKKYASKNAELQKVISACVKELDKSQK